MKRHILQVSSSASWGGMEMASVQLARRLSEKGYRVSFFAAPHSQTARALRGSGVAVIPWKRKGYVDPRGVRSVRKWLEREEVHLVHGHYAKDLWALVPAMGGRRRSIPLVLTKHIGTMKPKKDVLHRMLYRRVDAVIAISDVIRRNVLATHPISPHRVRLIPNGVDLSRFHPKRENRLAIRRTFGIPEYAKVIGMAGRLNWWKGYREFLLMAELLLQRGNDVWFLAVGGATFGEGAEAKTIRGLARSLNLKSRMIFTGFRNDMADLYSAMDLFVYPAYAEAFGLVLIEAMAAGLPVVSTDCDGIPEIVRNGVTGVLIPPRNPESLLRSVDRLLNHPEKMAALGRAGRKRAEDVYDFENVISQIERLYERLIKDRKEA